MKKYLYASFIFNRTFRKLLLTMKFTMLLVFLTVVQVYGSVYSQNTRLNLSVENKSMRDVFKLIEKESDFRFFFNDEFTELNKNLNLDISDKKIDDILAMILDNSEVTYRILENNVIVITPLSNPLPQPVTIKGKITDAATGEPLVGVNIVVEGTLTGTNSGINGEYSISVPGPESVLVFTFIGMSSQRIAVGSQRTIDVSLKSDLAQLEEVVVVGYGTQRRSDISGSVTTVKTKDLISQPTSDLQGMLKGKVVGLYVTLGDARPGGSSNVLLRGIRSLKGSNAPLYVVDGVALSSINEINIDDVESISVLKDASAQGIYGARGSNGVILITTKRGSNTGNKVDVSYNGYYSIQNVNPNFKLFSAEEFVQLRRDAYRIDLGNAANNWNAPYPDESQMFTPLEMERIASKSYVNWEDYAFKKDVPLMKHDVSISGGNEKTKYSASLGYYYQDGLRYSSDMAKYSGKVTLDQVISKTFKTGLSIYYTTYKQNVETNSWTSFITFYPVCKIYDDNNELVLYPIGDGKSVNPLYYQTTRENSNNIERLILNGYLEITPSFLPGLKYKFNASLNNRSLENNNFRSFEDPSSLTQGYASINFSKNKEYLIENIMTYDNTINNNHKLNVTLMQGIEPRYTYSTTATALQLGNDFFGINSLGTALKSEIARSLSDRKMVSFMGRVNYSLKEKYIFNFTVRADGSSVFGTNNKWGYFPSAAAAWNLHKEPFAKEISWIDEAKIRISYGQIGNQAIGSYGSLATAADAFYVTGDAPIVGYLPGNSLPNPNLKWETTTTANAGIDFSVLGRRLSGSVEYYKTNTIDLLVDRKLPTVLGYASIPFNLGEIQNTGIEAVLTGFIVSNSDFNWSMTVNYSKNRNKLVKGVLRDPVSGKYIDDVSNNWFINKPVNVDYDYKFIGIWQIGDDIASSPQPKARPGDVKVADISGPDGIPDGVISADDRVIIDMNPKWMGSLSTSISYKSFELSADLYTVQGVIRNNPFLSDSNYGGRLDNVNGIKRDYWTPENPSTTCFRPSQVLHSEYRGTLNYQDASYVRLRNATLSYTLPSKWSEKVGLSRIRVYIAGDNLWTDTKYLSYSPEEEADAYPETKNYTLGINIKF